MGPRFANPVMRKIVVCTNLSLDGVMQAPARPDEDERGGFMHGGWAAPYGAMAHAGQVFAEADALLLGRRTYEDFYNVWPKRTDSPFTPWLNNVRKYVASRTAREPLPWTNSVLLAADLRHALAAIKQEPGRNILVMGSGDLVRSLLPTGMIDEYVLLLQPMVLGSGRRLFPDQGTFTHLTLERSAPTPGGVVVAFYKPSAETK
jgi:dihydrofolate reductase